MTYANDVAVQAVYALGKIAAPSGLPQTIRVYLANVGTAAQTNLAVTLTISGANTFTGTYTVASLPVGMQGTLAFPALPATTLAAGTNTITVSVANDDNNANNSAAVAQLVTPTRLSYIEPGKALDGAFIFNSAAAGSVLSAKYTVAGTVTLADALISLGASGGPSFQVVVFDATGTGATPGNVLYTSPTQTRPAAGGDVTVTLPALQLTGSFFIGVKDLGTSGVGIQTQAETPVRATTFYYAPDGATGWIDLANSNLPRRLAIEVGLAPPPVCATPTALAVTATTTTTATVTFADASATGSYQLIYGPVGFQPTTGGTTVAAPASPATLTGLQPGSAYQVYVRSNCPGGGTSLLAGPVSFGTSCNATTTVSAFPYAESFDNLPAGQALPCGLTVLDANADGATWAITKTTPNSAPNALRYTSAITGSRAADDWFFTPALTTVAGTRYQVAFRYRGEGIAGSPSSYIEKLEVKAGTSATPAGQTTLLYTNASVTNTTYAAAGPGSTPAVAIFTPGAGTQYVGFHVYSDAAQGNLYVDDLSITASVVTATSSALLLRAITVFPNPSATGRFDLEIHGANAKGDLGVQVTNTLGQQVYAGSARDNYTNALDLSRLAPGLYRLTVRSGAETLTRQLAIVK